MAEDLTVDERTTIGGASLEWRAVRASGAGGQHVNKVATKVELRLDLDSCDALPGWAKARLRKLAGRCVDTAGRVVVVCQESRSQSANLEAARDRLATMIRQALARPRSRRKTRVTRASRERRLTAKRRRAETKQGRARIRTSSR